MKLDKQKLYDAYHNLITGNKQTTPVRTKPAAPSDQSEAEVLSECLRWLRTHGVLADRNNTGVGDLSGTGAMYRYGIKGGGDIFAVLPPHGQHIEIECKSGKGGILRDTQMKRKRRVEQAGGIYIVVHSVQELADALLPKLPGLFVEE